jgi:hypothetical protein
MEQISFIKSIIENKNMLLGFLGMNVSQPALPENV